MAGSMNAMGAVSTEENISGEVCFHGIPKGTPRKTPSYSLRPRKCTYRNDTKGTIPPPFPFLT